VRNEADHLWIIDVLKDLEAYAKSHSNPKIASLIYAARGAVSHVLNADIEGSRNGGSKEEQWFAIVLDELARYCNMHGLTETEGHLIAALDAWHEAQETEENDGKVITYPFGI
jgi:hypothetical protein